MLFFAKADGLEEAKQMQNNFKQTELQKFTTYRVSRWKTGSY